MMISNIKYIFSYDKQRIMSNSKINVYILDTAVSQVPIGWKRIPEIKKYFVKYNRLPLINASKHQKYLKSIPKVDRLDRPDILHFGLLTLLGYARLNNKINIFFNLNNKIYHIDNHTKLPRDQNRFYGLIETIIIGKYSGTLIKECSLPDDFNNTKKIIFSKTGTNVHKISNDILEYNNFIFGGFSFGSMRTNFNNSEFVRLSENSLELWTAISLSFQYLFPN